MKILEKSRFLYLAYWVHVVGVTDHGHLDAAKVEVWHLHEELEPSHRSREELTR